MISVALAACLAVGSIAALNAETGSDLADLFAVKADAATIVDSGKCGDNVTYTLDSDGVLTISGTGAMTGYSWRDAPWQDADVKSVVISDGVTSIGGEAFYGCTGLTSITIPGSVTAVGGRAFFGCTSLEEIQVNDTSKTYISVDGVLFNKEKTSLILFPAGKTGEYIVPDGTETIGGGAFYGCTALTSVAIPNSVTTIGGGAFYGCTGLTSVIIPDGSTSIGGGVFSGCTGLTDISVGGKSVNAKRVVSFDFWGEAITSCNDSDYIGPLLVPEESENGKVRIGIVLQNCVGKNFADLLIDYDPDVLDPATCKVYKSNFGEAMDLIGSHCLCECNPTVPGQAKIGFCFAESVLSEEEFAERAEKTNLDFDFDYNADKAEILVLEIEKKAESEATQTDLRLLGVVDSENFYDVTFTIPLENASDDKHIEPTTEPTTEPETTPAIPDSGETTEKAECSHICHKKGITAILYNIARFFWKLFKINKLCDCGVAHY